MEFRVGDNVFWKSQAGGTEKIKIGIIYKIIPADRIYKQGQLLDEISKFTLMFDTNLNPRPEVSYLVKVKSNGQRKEKLYRPRKNVLTLLEKS